MRWLILAILVTSCGQQPVVRPVRIDSRLVTQVNAYLGSAYEHGVNVDLGTLQAIQVDDLRSGTLGVCSPDRATVTIDPIALNNDALAWETLTHELGHCLFDLQHGANRIMKATYDWSTFNITDDERSIAMNQYWSTIKGT